jgi:hypothetical protein
MTIKESGIYDNFIAKKAEPEKKNNIFDVLNIEEEIIQEQDTDEEWRKHWKGMPEYEQEDNKTYKTIYLHFRNKEDFEAFCKNYKEHIDKDQTITQRTKSMWFPHLNREENALLRWIEE